MPQLALTDEEILNCFDVMFELRPHLVKQTFVNIIKMMQKEGYHLAYIKDNNQLVALAGYRMYHNLFMGKHLYVDDLVTSSNHRSHGYGKQMIDWIKNVALENGCNICHLDSGTHRAAAHKFYFKEGFNIASYHFSQKLS